MRLAGRVRIALWISDHEGRPCSARTVARYLAEGMPARKSGRDVVAESSEVQRWLVLRWPASAQAPR